MMIATPGCDSDIVVTIMTFAFARRSIIFTAEEVIKMHMVLRCSCRLMFVIDR